MQKISYYLLLLFSILGLQTLVNGQIVTPNPNHAVGTVSGNYVYTASQTPDPLVEIYPVTTYPSSPSIQWQQSASPLSGFVNIAGATQSTYTFPGPLTQTTYYRRRSVFINSMPPFLTQIFYSNVIKISVVSPSWEDKNYVREHTIKTTGITSAQQVEALAIGDKLQTTSYMDGLGRAVQTVSRETATPAAANGTWGDAVQFQQYDAYGRSAISNLPYTTQSQPGKFKTAPATEQPQYYTTNYSESPAKSTISFEANPLNRVANIKEPGSAWAAGAGKSVSYELNDTNDIVKAFTIAFTPGSIPKPDVSIGPNGSYANNTLYKTNYTDEYGKMVIEFKNKWGQLVLKKVELENTHADAYDGWICTYYVYDDFGRLRMQLHPEAVKYLVPRNFNFYDYVNYSYVLPASSQKVLDELCFQYFYDDKGRMTWKKAPGAAPLNMIYDNRDRLVFTQDGNQAALSTPQWTATIYDALDRPLATGLYNTTKTIANLQADINNAPAVGYVTVYNSINTGGNFISLITSGSPLSYSELNTSGVTTIVKYLFYDQYNQPDVKSFSSGFNNTAAYSTSDPNVQSIIPTARTAGMVTVEKVRVLGSNSFLNSTNYYDERGSLIQTLEDNIRSGSDVTTFQYHFDGRVLSTYHNHSTAAANFYTGTSVLTKYLFDKLGRTSAIQKQFDGNPFITVVGYDYDDMGRLKTKHLHPGYTGSGGSELESLSYSYNIHNQITGINKDYALKTPGNYNKWSHFFGMYLGFDNKDGVFTNARLNGQVTGVLWNTMGDDAQRKYDFTYDNAGRLTNASFKEQQHPNDGWSNGSMDFSVSGYTGKITYDLNGNLLSMLQKGVLPGGGAPLAIDDLRYAYDQYTNKLQSVTDAMANNNVNGNFGDFKDGTNGSAPDYVYDANGNVVVDLNKNAKDLGNVAGNGIHYNFMDKPDQIRIAGKGTINITYSGDGEKLKRTFTPEGSGTASTTSYINGYIYTSTGSSNDALTYVNFEEGRLRVVTPTTQNNGYDQLTVNGNISIAWGMSCAFDYYMLDYQQNVRMILTEETHAASNMATMETGRASAEEPVFGQTGTANEVAATRAPVPSSWSNNSSASASKLGTIAGHTIGPNTLQKVMGGDYVTSTVNYYYSQLPTGGTNNMVGNVLSSLVQALSGGPATSAVKGAASTIQSNLGGLPAFSSSVQPSNTNTQLPQAFLTVLFFDERFNLVPEADGGVYRQQVGSLSASIGSSLNILGVRAPKNGYMYAYLSNSSDQDVYFDDFKVSLTNYNILEENHYYAFGLKISGISSKRIGDAYQGKIDNRYGMQGAFSELDEEVSWNEFALRNYDAQIGRFVQQDPYDQFASPYVGMGNDPVNGIDPTGGEKLPFHQFANIISSSVSVAGSAARVSASFFQIATTTVSVIAKVWQATSILTGVFETKFVGSDSPNQKFIGYTSSDDAAIAWTGMMGENSIKHKFESSSFIYELKVGKTKIYGLTKPESYVGDDGTDKTPFDINKAKQEIPKGARIVGYIHSHGAFRPRNIDKPDNIAFSKNRGISNNSPTDETLFNDHEELDFYLANPAGQILIYRSFNRNAGERVLASGFYHDELLNKINDVNKKYTLGPNPTNNHYTIKKEYNVYNEKNYYSF